MDRRQVAAGGVVSNSGLPDLPGMGPFSSGRCVMAHTYLVTGPELTDERTHPPGGTTDKWRVVLAAEHERGLARVRVAALQEARAAVDGLLYRGSPADYDGQQHLMDETIRDALAAIDRLIDAATTGGR